MSGFGRNALQPASIPSLAVALAGQRDEFHRARLPRFETHGCAGDDVQPEAACALAIEFESSVDLVKVKVRADLHRTVARVRDGDDERFAAGVELDIAGFGEDFAWNHDVLGRFERGA